MSIQILPFSPERAPYFDQYNRAWIATFFWVEPADEALLTDPQRTIIDAGGEVWFAQMDGAIVGAAAMLNNSEGVFEFSKLGVASHAKGRGIGRLLLRHCLERARQRGGQAMRILSHSSLVTACDLYRQEGFVDVAILDADRARYKRADTSLWLTL